MLEFTGYLSAILLGFCGVPQAYKAWQTGSLPGVSWIFLYMWGGGELLAAVYVVGTNLAVGSWQIPLLANYALNVGIIAYLITVKARR